MEVLIESMTGRLTRLTVNPLETVKGLKARIWKTEGVPLSQQSLVYKNQELDDSRQLQEYNIVAYSVVKLVLITRSGPVNFKRQTDSELSVSNLVEYLQSDSLPGPSSGASERVGLMVFRDGDHLNWYHLVDPNKTFEENNGDLPELVDSTNASDMNKSDSRRASAAKRAEENYRTMLRMRELRHSMERLNLERSRRRQTNGVEEVQNQEEASNSRQRRSSGSSSTTTIRMKSSKTFPVSNAFLVANAQNCAHFMSAAEDTSAKESSAGETEFEDCHPVYNLPPLHNAIADDLDSNTLNTIKFKSKNNLQMFASGNNFAAKFSTNDNVPTCSSSSKHICLKRDPMKLKHFHILSSSCSDLEPDSSVLFSSDYDAVPNSDQDQELYTAEDCWSYEENDQGENGFDDEEHHTLYGSDYHDAVSDHDDETNADAGPNPILNSKSLTTFSGKELETTASDPSEMSSGAIICDLATMNRRSKVRRKYFGQRHLTKRPQLVTPHSFRVPIDESAEEQSSTFEINALRINGIQEFMGRPRAAHQVRFAPRRARSKPRLIANKATSTGESSSDERDGRRDSSTGSVSHGQNEKVRQAPIAKNTAVNGKPKTMVGSRLISTSKKFAAEKTRPFMSHVSVASNFTSNAGFYPAVSTSPSSSTSAVVRNHKLPQSSQSQQRCNICGCRLNLSTTFQCRCGKTVCPRHRTSDHHSCGYELRRDTVNVTDGRKQTGEQLPKL